MQARGQTQTVTLPITAPKSGQEPGHRATLQPGRAGRGGVRWGVGLGLWVAAAFRSPFTSCLVPHHHHFEGGGRFAECVVMQEGGTGLWVWVDYIWKPVGGYGGVDLKNVEAR